MKSKRIIVADDHELFREGMVTLINAQPELEVVGQAGDGLEILTLARDLNPDLIMLDISMPVCNGLEATRLLRSTPGIPAVPILILTVHDEDEKLFEAIRAGANSYILKSTNSVEFLRGLRSTLAGEYVLPPKLAAQLIRKFAQLSPRMDAKHAAATVQGDLPDLTPREYDVLKCLAEGITDKEIAAKLSISLHTVKTHVRNILSKLHAGNRYQAARLAQKKGLLDD